MKRERPYLLFGLKPTEYSWRGVGWVAVFYIGAIICGAILGPLLFKALHAWHQAAPNELTTYLSEKDLEQYFDRARWAFAIVLLPVLFKVCGFFPYGKIRRLSLRASFPRALLGAMAVGFHRLGYRCDQRGWAHFGRCFGFGVALAGFIVLAQLIFTPTNLKPDLTLASVLGSVAGALAGGLALGFFEEMIFRGVVFRCFYAAWRPVLAVVLTSAFFAYAHFRHPDALFEGAIHTPGFAAGWEIAFWTLVGIVKSFAWIPFCNLFMFGNLLTLVQLRSGSLMSSAGLHAGAVFIMLSYSKNFQIHGGTAAREVWGGAGIVDGIVPLVLLTGLVLVLSVIVPKLQAHKVSYCA